MQNPEHKRLTRYFCSFGMTDRSQDPDFLRIYHSADKEWPGYKVPNRIEEKISYRFVCDDATRLRDIIIGNGGPTSLLRLDTIEISFVNQTFGNTDHRECCQHCACNVDYVTDDKNASLPLLISEIFRLIPYIGSEYVHFHPKNMPEVTIDKVEIIGIVTDKTDVIKYTSYTVDDSTGAIPVLFANKSMNEDESSEDEPSVCAGVKPKLKLPHGLTATAPYSYERHIQTLWHRARDEKLSYDEIVLYDYVHVIGFCAMAFRNQKDLSKLTDEDIQLGRLFFFGISARRINEAEHNAMTKSLVCQVARERYFNSDTNDNTAMSESETVV